MPRKPPVSILSTTPPAYPAGGTPPFLTGGDSVGASPPPPPVSMSYDGTFPGDHATVVDTAAVGTADAWEDAAGGVWSVVADRLTGTTADGTGYASQFLRRPAAEAGAERQVTAYVPSGSTDGSALLGLVLRLQDDGAHFLCHVNSSGVTYLYAIAAGGGVTAVASESWAWGTYQVGHDYRVTFTATGSPGSVTLVGEVRDESAGEVVGRLVGESSVALGAGRVALSCWQSGAVRAARVALGPITVAQPALTGFDLQADGTTLRLTASQAVYSDGTAWPAGSGFPDREFAYHSGNGSTALDYKCRYTSGGAPAYFLGTDSVSPNLGNTPADNGVTGAVGGLPLNANGPTNAANSSALTRPAVSGQPAVDGAGTTLTLTFDRAVTLTGGSASLTLGGGLSGTTATYTGLSGAALTFGLDRTVPQGVTGTFAFGSGQVADDKGFTNAAASGGVDNASTQTAATATALAFASGTLAIDFSGPVSGTETLGLVLLVNGSPASSTGGAGTGTAQFQVTYSTPVVFSDTLKVNYSGGNWTGANGLPVADFTGRSVTNNVPPPAPTYVNGSVAPDGLTFTVTFSEAVTGGADTDNFNLLADGVGVPLTLVGGEGTTTLTYTTDFGHQIVSGQVLTCNNNGSAINHDGTPLGNFTGAPVDNFSTQ